MRTPLYSFVFFFFLLVAPFAAAQKGPDYACQGTGSNKFTIEDLARFVREDGKGNKLPGRFGEMLGFGSADLAVTRVAYLDHEDDTRRSIDVPSGNSDYVLFILDAKRVILWRVTPAGKTLRAAEAGKNTAVTPIVPSSKVAGELTALCNYIFEQIEREKSERKAGKPQQ